MAIEDLFGPPGSFIAAYEKNIAAATDELAELDPILMTILELWDETNCWSGTMQDLQSEIAQRLKASGSRVPVPTGLAQISGHVKRIKPLLIKKGLNVAFQRATTKDRRRTLSQIIVVIKDRQRLGDAACTVLPTSFGEARYLSRTRFTSRRTLFVRRHA